MKKSPQVIVSSSSRLHSHRHAYALQKAEMLSIFATSIWLRDGIFPYTALKILPERAKVKIDSFLSKRTHPGIPTVKVVEIRLAEICRLLFDKITFKRFSKELLLHQQISYDKRAKRLLNHYRPDILVGFEIGCAESFLQAKKLGIFTVLDLPALEHSFSSAVLLKAGLIRPQTVMKLGRRKKNELDLADHIICVSNLARKTLLDVGIERTKITVIRLGVDTRKFSPSSHNQRNNEQRLKIVYVGSLSRSKGVDILVEAFARAKIEGAELLLVGSKVDIDASLLDRPSIRWIPYLAVDVLAKTYRSANLFVLPSLLDSWGQVVPEAMACGLPVVVSNKCGAAELVNSQNGWVVPAGDSEALSNCLSEALSDPEALKSKGLAARKTVENLTWERYEENIARLHCRLVHTSRSKLE